MFPDEPLDSSRFTALVSRVLRIDDITTGDQKQGYLVRYRGQLYGDSAEAYDQLSANLRPLEVTPLFRQEGETHVIILLPGIIQPKPSNPLVNLVMFGLTLLSMIFAGALSAYQCIRPLAEGELMAEIFRNLPGGIPFALSMLSILLAHEFGHYLAGRFHKVHVTLPYFIPFPFSPFGTMGAFIQLKEPPKNKRILLDIGIAGPLAGLVVAIPILLIGIALSPVQTIAITPSLCTPNMEGGIMLEGNSVLYLGAKYLIHGELLPAPSSFGALPPAMYWVRYFFTSLPLPIGGRDIILHPMAWAGWAGLLVTALNLIPAGQLDGGHVMYVLLGRRARRLLPFIFIFLLGMGLFWSGWWLWAALIFFLGRVHAEPLDQITKLDKPRTAIALLGIIIFFLVFTPVPLMQTP
jgi:Zn-dependent protease